jgi:uroporphyrinogen-III decarboxylase
MMSPKWNVSGDNSFEDMIKTEIWREGGSEFTRKTIETPTRTLSSLTRRDVDAYTIWHLNHLLSDADDLKAYLDLPLPEVGEPDISALVAEEEALGDAGIVMVDTGDPICEAAGLFSMEDYTILALTEQTLFHKLLERLALVSFARCEKICEIFPGHLWRVVGAEYAAEPYLPPYLFEEYVVRYTGRMVKMIKDSGGYARIHSHGRLRKIIPYIQAMDPDGLDPVEPPIQGDMELWEIREAIGKDTVLFGNLEANELENMPTDQFEEKIKIALDEGRSGDSRGFVLMPSACPYGRTITPLTMANYEAMIRLAHQA